MKLYLDEDSASVLLVRLLRAAGHQVLLPDDFGLVGAKDPAQLQRSILEQAVFLSHNYEDFKLLHDLIQDAQGHHPGILVVRKDNDPHRDLKPAGIVRAIRKLEAAGVPIADQYITLNYWR